MPEKVNWTYLTVRGFARFWVRRFFRKIQVAGTENIPTGPVIFAINHPNNFVDSMLVGYAIERKIHYLATAQLFRNKLLSLFLQNVGVIPVYRKQDDASHGEKNISTFQACYEILEKGGAIGIYPEGTTHSEPRVRRIKTGAARIALESEKLHHPGVVLVPVGLNFSVRKSFRSEVVVNIGAPIAVAPYLEKYSAQPVETVELLTEKLQQALENEVIHIDQPEMDRLVKEIEEIYKGELIRDLAEIRGVSKAEVDSFRLSKRLVAGIEFFNQKDPDLIRKLHADIHIYKSRLKKVKIHDDLIKKMAENPTTYRRFLLRIILMIITLPIGLWGAINHFLPYRLSRFFTRKIAKRETDYATVRILSGIVLYSLFYGVQIYFVLRRYGLIPASVYGLTLPMFGAFAYYYKEKFRVMRDDFKSFFVLITRKSLLKNLIHQRERLINTMDEAKEEYLRASVQA
jgi:1-acyl-sn-glycerol-3-phosphate acyltransferase